jgi:uncharacterized protein
MLSAMRPFFTALACSWIALIGAAWFYSNRFPQSHWIMAAALPAFLLEAVFYLGAIFEEPRDWFRGVPPRRSQGLMLWLSALLPYLVFSVCARTFQANAFEVLAVLTLLLAYWYIVAPRRWAYDVGFLIIVVAPVVLHVFSRIYISPEPSLRIGDALGHLMWIRLGIAALLILRGWYPGEFGFWPTGKEWIAGSVWFAIAAIPLCALGVAIGMIRFAPLQRPWWQAAAIIVGSFFGVLWVVALSEELFFRGVIEKFFLNFWRSPVLAVAISAVLYGCSHLWYRAFPNWREALVTAVLGVPCGIAYLRTGSVRAPMVTHALAAVTVRALFRYT